MPARRAALAAAFTGAAIRYWFSVFPIICRETRHWHRRASAIPDPVLRRLALEAQRVKRGNIEGSAAFAAFTPHRYRDPTIRAQVAFQSIYDYVDTLAEQPNEDPILNGEQLHRALLVALDRDATHPDYYAHQHQREDNGYLQEIVNACRCALNALPSHRAIATPVRSLTKRIITYQSLNLSQPQGGHDALEQWALKEAPTRSGLRWWETAASAGSSLGVFALIAAAAQPDLPPAHSTAILNTYWPWVGALHSLLDSLVDRYEDTAAEQRSLLDYYASPQETASRLGLLSTEALRHTTALPHSHQHTLVLTAMVSHYLSAPEVSSPATQRISDHVLERMGDLAKPMLLIFNARRRTSRIYAHLQPHTPREQHSTGGTPKPRPRSISSTDHHDRSDN